MKQKELHEYSSKYEIKVKTICQNPGATTQTETLENRTFDI